MAEIKKYVSLENLGLYDEKIKGVIYDGDEAVKAYVDGLATNYDAAGSAATAEANAKDYAGEQIQALAGGAVKANTDAIAKLNGGADVEGSVAKAIADAKALIDADIDVVEGKADAAQAAADAAQGEVDALETFVGVLPEGSTATSVIDYVNVKTAGIATDASLAELTGQVNGLQNVVNGITADYLTSEDKTELANLITAEETRAKGVEGGFETRIKAIEDDYLTSEDAEGLQGNIDGVVERVAAIEEDYLTSEDAEEIQGKIDLKADQTALDAEVTRAKGVEEGLQTQINTIMNNPDAEGVINSINEFTKYITEHGEIADGFRTDIDKNKEDIAAEVKRAGEAELALSGRIDAHVAIDHDFAGADAALKSELMTEINKKAAQADMEAAVDALEAVDADFEERIATIETQLGEGEGSVADQISDAKQEAIDVAAQDATDKADAAEEAAKGHADSLNTAMNTRVEALEAIDHEHANKTLLDTYTQTEDNLADAVAKKHEHSNFDVLEGITVDKVSAWDAAEGNAKDYADGLNTTMNTRVDALEVWHDNFIEVSEEDINALFA